MVGRVEGPLSLWLGVAKGTFKRVGALGGGLASGRFHCLARYDICSPVQTPWRMGWRETRVGEETPIVGIQSERSCSDSCVVVLAVRQ